MRILRRPDSIVGRAGMSETQPLSVEFKHGVSGLLITCGIALLGISLVNATLFRPGIGLLMIGLLSYVVKETVHVAVKLAEENQEHGLYGADAVIGTGWVLSLMGIAVIVLWIFWPFLGI